MLPTRGKCRKPTRGPWGRSESRNIKRDIMCWSFALPRSIKQNYSEDMSELRGCDARVVPLGCCALTLSWIRFLARTHAIGSVDVNVSWHFLHLEIDAISTLVRLLPGRVLANQRIVTDELFLTLRPTTTATRMAWRSLSHAQFAVALDLMWRSDVVAVGVGRGPHARERKKGGYNARHQRVDLCCAVHKVR